ncbi:FHA domain-containing protein [Novipirellula artificiosorum]|uniref:FHA domain-containing protein n=1 Tax=Novipirellula artificiosorum TaxID=2528016 RepID=UPI0018CDF4D8|nr:FHA domain-containing protein [Novipirellula artificiosorum]
MIAIESGPRAGARWLLRSGEKLTFGRSEQADIIFADDRVLSSNHFRISLEGDLGRVEDLRSTNGTWVNEVRVIEKTLTDGDQIRAGSQTFVYHLESSFSTDGRLQDSTGDREGPAAAKIGPSTVPTKKELPSIESLEEESPAEQKTVEECSELDWPADARDPVDLEESDSPVSAAVPPPISEPLADPDPFPAGQSISPLQKTQPKDLSTKPKTAPNSPSKGLPSTLTLEIQGCPSGLYRASQTTESIEAARSDQVTIGRQLSNRCPLTFIIDFGRTKIKPPEIVQGDSSDFLLANLPSDVAALVSPRMLRPTNLDQQEDWLRVGWGKDGMIVLFTHVDVPPLLEHLQRLIQASACDPHEAKGMLGLCWPSLLEASLREGDPTLAAEIIEPCEAVLVESPATAGGWELYGDHRLPQLLMACEISTTSPNDA